MPLRSALRRLYKASVLDPWRSRFEFFQRHGLHVVAAHYDSPVPDTRLLGDSWWTQESAMVGVDLNVDGQLRLLDVLAAQFRAEYSTFPAHATGGPFDYYLHNGGFGPVDGEILYGILRQFRPRRVIEVGSGHSTRCIAKALDRNRADGAAAADFVAIDPSGAGVTDRIPAVTRALHQRVETVPIDQLTALDSGDVLFIDSPHVVTVGGAVTFLFLEVIPRLRPGVLVHVHDVFLPAHYPREWVVRDRRFYAEQYMLQAFLAFNREFEIMWMGSYMHARHSARLAAVIPSYDAARDRPGSFWMRRL